MHAVVLVGGEGTRLRPLTLTTPKQMLPIAGRPMIEHVIEGLARHGIDEAVLSLGYLPDAFKEAYPGGSVAGVKVRYAVEPEPLDTAGAVRFAADHAGIDETFVVVNGDVLTDLDVTALVAFHRACRAEGTIALHPVPDPSPFGVVPTDADGRVLTFIEKPARDEAPTNQINAGTYVLEPAVLQRIPGGRRVSIERETFPAMVRDRCLYARADDAYWLDTGTTSAYLQAHRDLIAGRRGVPPAAGARLVGDGIWVLGDPLIEGDVDGPSFVDDGASIGAGARVRASMVGAGCVIESGAVVVDSVLLPGARIAGGSTVTGSIIGPRSIVGERCDIRPISVLGAEVVVPSGTVLDGAKMPG